MAIKFENMKANIKNKAQNSPNNKIDNQNNINSNKSINKSMQKMKLQKTNMKMNNKMKNVVNDSNNYRKQGQMGVGVNRLALMNVKLQKVVMNSRKERIRDKDLKGEERLRYRK